MTLSQETCRLLCAYLLPKKVRCNRFMDFICVTHDVTPSFLLRASGHHRPPPGAVLYLNMEGDEAQ